MLRFRVLLAAVAIVFFCRTIPAQTIEVNEKATRLMLREGKNQLQLSVRNLSPQTVQIHLSVELLDPNGKVQAKTDKHEALSPGENRIIIPFPWSDLAADHSREMLWERLRYSLEFPEQKSSPIAGIISIGQITPQLFELKTWRPEFLISGSSYRVRIRAQHPVTQRPAGGVTVNGELGFGDDKAKVLQARAVTDKNGNAVLAFDIPDDQQGSSPELAITASRDGIQRQVSSDVNWLFPGDALITTDKPIYQPGQIMHMRALLVSESKRAKANASVILTVTDPDDTMVYRETLQSSRFGIVHTDWPIPENQLLGNYRIEVAPVDGDDRHWRATERVKISRYELPDFVVNVKPDKPYYLPGQNAEVEVRGDYLFGKAVTHGHVRVVREEERHWNYKDQKWEIDEGDEYQGDLDTNGRFTAHVSLKNDQDDFSDDNDYTRFKDLRFAAYVTDATTHRTEQRRFDLRITPYPIHVYYMPDGEQTSGLPLNFYISAQYADGSSCECEITIQRYFERNTGAARQEQYSQLRSVRTNRYGLAHITALHLPQLEDNESDLGLMFEAHDRRGLAGRHKDSLSLSDRDAIRVSADKTLYVAGEPIAVQIESSLKTSTLAIEVLSHSKLIETEVAALHNGRAWLTLPYSPQFQDEVIITVYDMMGWQNRYEYWRIPFGSRTVLFPQKHELNLDVHLEKNTFRPGDEARADFRVQGPKGENVEGALGLVITDKAVDVRYRTEQEFNSGAPYSWSYWSEWTSVAGFSRNDLDKVNLNEPVSADFD
jgi:hypothetical protein